MDVVMDVESFGLSKGAITPVKSRDIDRGLEDCSNYKKEK